MSFSLVLRRATGRSVKKTLKITSFYPISQKISKIIGYPVEESIGYPTPGSFGTWAGIEKNIPTITLELDEDIEVEALEKPIFEIFEMLENQEPGAGGEIQLTDAIDRLMDRQAVYAYDFEGQRYDVGDKFGFIKATIDFALNREDLGKQVRHYLLNDIAPRLKAELETEQEAIELVTEEEVSEEKTELSVE